MKTRKVGFKYKGKKISLKAEECNNFGIGLMFKSKNTQALLFDFKGKTREALTSLFVFFSFVAIWLDGKNKVIDIRVVRPFRLAIFPKKPFSKLVEIPVNAKYAREIRLLCPPPLATTLTSGSLREVARR